MRNKIFVFLCSAIFLALFVGAPLVLFLTESGVLPYQNVGNKITAEKTYDEDHPLYDALTAIEEGKVKIKDTYINYLPGFLDITNLFKPLKSAVNRPVIDFFAATGRELLSAKCRHTYTQEIVPPTCTEEGYTLMTCKLCGMAETKDRIAAKGHTLGDAGTPVAARCEYEGYTPISCLYCSYTLLEERVLPTQHSFGAPEKDGAFLVYACTGCDTRLRVPQNSASEHEHSENVQEVDGGCDALSYTRYTCSLCDSERRENLRLPKGHQYVSEVFAPTCTEEGYTRCVCALCSDTKDIDKTSARGHRYEKKTVPPTVYEEGYDLYTCLFCPESFEANYVPKLILGIEPPETVEDPKGTRYRASLLSKSGMFRIYELTATYPDGTENASIVRVIAHDRDGLYDNMLEMSEMIEAMVDESPDVNWYFSFATNIEATELCDEFFPEESVLYIYEDFLQSLPEDVKVSDIAINSFRDYANKFYVTDHHWNHVGVLEAYYRIISMLKENYEDIEPMPLDDFYLFEGVKFYGSLARTNASYDYYDEFGVHYYDLPPHTLVRDPAIAYGSANTLPENLARYLVGEYATSRGYNHYTEFYRVPMKIEYPENNTGRRLLIIGDSYSLPLLEVVAASFDVTFVRYEDRGWNALPEDLYIDEFVKENGITDILVIEDIVKSIMKGYGNHYPSGFLNIYPSYAYKKED